MFTDVTGQPPQLAGQGVCVCVRMYVYVYVSITNILVYLLILKWTEWNQTILIVFLIMHSAMSDELE